MEERFKFRYVNELTGAFVLAVLALVVIGVRLSARSQRWFSRTYAFDVLLPEKGSFGLSRGSEIFILGVSAGSVYGIDVGDDGRIHAHARVRSDFQRFVRADSVATIKKVLGLAGDAFMEISRGTGGPLPAQGATIPCQTSEELPAMVEAALNELRAEVIPVVKKAGTTLGAWAELAQDLKQTQVSMRELERLIEGLQRHWLVRKYINKTNPPPCGLCLTPRNRSKVLPRFCSPREISRMDRLATGSLWAGRRGVTPF